MMASGMSRPSAEDEGNAFTSGLDPDMFVRFLDTPERIVLEFTPEMSIIYLMKKLACLQSWEKVYFLYGGFGLIQSKINIGTSICVCMYLPILLVLAIKGAELGLAKLQGFM